jgi:CheY-like chemotaxis protein
MVQVTDTGVGIDPHALPRIFNAFEQGDATTARQFGGLGLGLAISKALAELHGGTITATSAGRDRGATFTVKLPTAASVDSAPSGGGAASAPGVATRGASAPPARPRLLLAEDHPDTIRAMKRLLERDGYDVRTAGSVAAALEVLKVHPVDVLVSDIGLPDGTGHDLMRAARAMRPDVVGIAVSGFGMESDYKGSIDAGFAAHLTKPVDTKDLEAAIRAAVGKTSRA